MFWDRYARHRISRRRALQWSAAAGGSIAALALVGCDGGGSTIETSPTPGDPSKPDILNPAWPPQRGGKLVTANAADFGTFDPHLGVAVASAYFPRIYNLLINQSASKPEFLVHDLAESFEIPDDQTFIFKIRPGVKIAPNDLGVPERDLDAEDARVSIERIKAEGAASNHSFARDHVVSVQATGEVLTVRTPAPYAWFLNRIGLFFNAIPPRELLAGDLSRLTTHGAGGGPFRLVSVSEGEKAILEANPNYYRKDADNGNAQLPYVDALEVRVIFEKATQRTAFLSGQVHAYMTGSSSEARSLNDAVISRDPAFAYNSFTMNPERPPFNDPRVRRAVSRAINRQEYIDLVYEGDAKVNGLVQWSLGSYALPEEELAALQPFDLEEARRLVDEVGGVRMKVMYPANTPVLEHDRHMPIFLKQMRDAGIEVEDDGQVFTQWVTNLREINYQCTLNLNQIYETPEIPLNIHTRNGPFGDGTYLRGMDDPEIEAAINRASTALDADERVELVREAQRVIYRKDPISLPLVTPYTHTAWRKSVKNIPTGVGTSSFLLNTFWIET